MENFRNHMLTEEERTGTNFEEASPEGSSTDPEPLAGTSTTFPGAQDPRYLGYSDLRPRLGRPPAKSKKEFLPPYPDKGFKQEFKKYSEEKGKNKRERNRIAARRCREKKTKKLEELEAINVKIVEENRRLRAREARAQGLGQGQSRPVSCQSQAGGPCSCQTCAADRFYHDLADQMVKILNAKNEEIKDEPRELNPALRELTQEYADLFERKKREEEDAKSRF